MLKSGLIAGAVALVLSFGATLLSPLCTPCLALFLGLGAGFLGGVFDRPPNNGGAAKTGSAAGGIGGLGALVGQVAGAGANALLVGPEGAADLASQFGFAGGDPASFQSSYWGGLVGSTCCLGILDVALMAGLGALGGLLWWQITGKQSASTSTPPDLLA